MSDERINLNDPACESSEQDFECLCRAAGEVVRAESVMLNRKRQREAEKATRKPDQAGERM